MDNSLSTFPHPLVALFVGLGIRDKSMTAHLFLSTVTSVQLLKGESFWVRWSKSNFPCVVQEELSFRSFRRKAMQAL